MTSKGLKFQTFYMKNGKSLDLWKVILEIQHWTHHPLFPRSLLAAGPHGPFWARWRFCEKFEYHKSSHYCLLFGWKNTVVTNLQCGGWFFCQKDRAWFIYSWQTIRIRPSSRPWRYCSRYFQLHCCNHLTFCWILSNQFMIFHLNWKVGLGKTGGCLRMNLGRQG